MCKPCWELKYCPYGPLVEDSPLLPPTKAISLDWHEHQERTLETGRLPGGELLDETRRRYLEKSVAEFNLDDYPDEIPDEIVAMQCTVFGHICPVVFNAEFVTETTAERRVGRYIPFHVKMRVARRDYHTCQECGKTLLDTEVEFDHIIPMSKGGSSEEHNIRLTCFACNRSKSDKAEI